MTSPFEIRVVLADDDPFVRRGVADIFAATPDIRVVESVSDGDEVPDAVRNHRPHVVLMDLKMPRVGGLEATRRMMALPEPPKVVVMTAMDVDDLVVQSIEAGAHSFLSKSEAPETFQMSIRVVAAGKTLFSEESVRQIVTARPRESTGGLERLTDREIEVLRVMATGATNAAIGQQLFLGETTVKTHLSSVFQKLEVGSRVGAALVAFRAGLVS
ncbi:DNA-binding response regulator [Rhodococcoides trifolii]|uniref:DNA-binding response regulator n=1 Tax=Rhodococcoides trifolii TaxID=908250 RepID=A0A917CVM4_9NOCA|nr:response regulator transcription factor [Rhodococcus trifolii]GGF99155.1 DNA-binding response regulator [Rhodococcus trifolii]